GVDLRVSHDAGRYLCEFLYYVSLAKFREKSGEEGERPVLFLHVPQQQGDELESEEEAVELGRGVILSLIRAVVSDGLVGRRKWAEA
ncbi:hypothetical protein GP486_003999, partial [Trichoglossum hirsutum]